MGSFKPKSIILPGKGVNKYGEVVQKVLDGEWCVLEVPVLAAPWSSGQHASVAEETKSEGGDGEETVKIKGGDADGTTTVLAILYDVISSMGDLEKRQSKLEKQDRVPK